MAQWKPKVIVRKTYSMARIIRDMMRVARPSRFHSLRFQGQNLRAGDLKPDSNEENWKMYSWNTVYHTHRPIWEYLLTSLWAQVQLSSWVPSPESQAPSWSLYWKQAFPPGKKGKGWVGSKSQVESKSLTPPKSSHQCNFTPTWWRVPWLESPSLAPGAQKCTKQGDPWLIKFLKHII